MTSLSYTGAAPRTLNAGRAGAPTKAGLAALGLALALSTATGCLPQAPAPAPAPDLALPPVLDMTSPDQANGTITDTVRLSAREIFDTLVLPSLSPTCGGCHNRDAGVGPGFLRSASTTKYDPYPITVAWTNFVVEDPQLSQLLRKGQHEGPPLNLDQADIVLRWLTQEKAERDATTVVPFKPQVKPFTPVISAGRNMAPYNTVDLGQINRVFAGAYLRFSAVPISARGGLEISDLRLFNVKPGAMAGEQRTIRMRHPLFVVWSNNIASPDPVDNFAGSDRTVSLNQNDSGAMGVLIVPGLFTLNGYRSGNALSVVFDELSLVPAAAGRRAAAVFIAAHGPVRLHGGPGRGWQGVVVAPGAQACRVRAHRGRPVDACRGGA